MDKTASSLSSIMGMLIVVPVFSVATIWAVNLLFNLQFAYDLKTIVAVSVLILLLD